METEDRLITFIPRNNDEGYAISGIRAAGWALLVFFVGIPYLLYTLTKAYIRDNRDAR